MTGVTDRPALFSEMGQAFSSVFSNADIQFTVDGALLFSTVRGIFRQFREADLLEFQSPPTEAVTHKLSFAASDLPSGFDKERDSLSINDTAYIVNTLEDDGRAMLRMLLRETTSS